MSNLAGRHALVTGASKGIGAGVAQALAAAGATVVVGYGNDERGAARTVARIAESGGRAHAVQADLAQPAHVQRLMGRAADEFGPVDVLVNNAAVYSFQPFSEVGVDDFRRQYDTNVLGAILLTQAFVAQAPPAGGAVVNVLSSDLSSHRPGSALYTSTKGAVASLTRSLANELAAQRIRVNAIAPGVTRTEGAQALGLFGGDQEDLVVAATPLGRVGTPEDIGPVAAFLASEDARWITGEVLFASGGLR